MVAALDATFYTLVDLAKATDPQGKVAPYVDIASKATPMLQDGMAVECNMPEGHMVNRVVGKLSGSLVGYNEGLTAEKNEREQLITPTAMAEAEVKMDTKIAKKPAGKSMFQQEEMLAAAGLSETVESKAFYGNHGSNPKEPQGFASMYNDLTGDFSDYIVDGGGSGSDNTSVWLITWGPNTVHWIYPQGSVTGLARSFFANQRVNDSDSNPFYAHVVRFLWEIGICLVDYRFVRRVCNIDVSNLTPNAASGADLIDKICNAYYAAPTEALAGPTKTMLYCNKTVAKFLHKQAKNTGNVVLTLDNVEGKPVTSLFDAKVRISDSITSTESAVT